MKGKKIIVPVLLASLVASPTVAGVKSLTSKVFADETSATDLSIAGPGAKIKGYTSEVQKGDIITVPSVEATGTVKVTVTTPYGSKKVEKVTSEEEEPVVTTEVEVNTLIAGDRIKATETGYYTFSYEVTANGAVSSTIEELSIFVKGDTYSMSMYDNTYFVVPSNVNFVTGGTTLKFPVPEVYQNSEKQETLTGTLQLQITKPDGTAVTPITTISNDTTVNEKYFEYKFEQEGRYRYKYVYVVGGEIVAATNPKTVKLTAGYDLSDVELDFSLAGTMPSSASIGKEVTLPEVNVFDKTTPSTYLNAYTKITVQYVGNEEVSESEKKQVVTDFKFTPKHAGTYVITYEASIPAWDKTTGTKSYRIKDVADNEDPVIYLTNSYTVDQNGTIKVGATDITNMDLDEQLNVLGDLSYNLDAYYEVDGDGKVTVAIPAAFATDNSSSISDIIKNSRRELYKRGSSTNTLTLVDTEDGENIADINEVGYFTFSNNKGEHNTVWGADDSNYYVVKYILKDAVGNDVTYTYNLYIRTSLPDEGPQVTLDPALTDASVNKGETFTFSKPVVVDKHDGKVYDEKVETVTKYWFEKSDTTETEKITLTELNVNEDGDYEVVVSGDYTKLHIETVAKNHYATATTKTAVVEIKNPASDDKAPELKSFYANDFNAALVEANKGEGQALEGENITLDEYGKTNERKGAFDQNTVIFTPAVSFTDNSASLNMSVVVTYKANESAAAKTVKLSNFNTESVLTESPTGTNDAYTHTITNASFIASNAGYYYVTYIAKDGGNNVSFQTYAIYVNDTVGPRIEVPNASKYNTSIRPGQWFEIPSAIVYDNDIVIPTTVKTTVTGPNGAYELSSDNKSFRPLKTGTYYVTYTAEDNSISKNKTTSEPYAIEVKAELDEERFYIEYSTTVYETDYENVEYQDNSTLIQPETILIPKATAIDLDMNTRVNVAVPTVTDANGATKEVKESANSLYYEFTATSQGEHKVKYSATNEFGISISKEIIIKVGDTYAPTLKWVNKTENLPTNVDLNCTWEFDFDNLIIADEGSDDTIANEGISYTITMTDPDGEEIKVDSNTKTFTFDKQGDYYFKVVLKDKAQNSTNNDYKYKITVNEVETTTNEINNTTGTILIVTSVVVLGGVVVYFVVSGRKMSAKATKKNNKENKKQD